MSRAAERGALVPAEPRLQLGPTAHPRAASGSITPQATSLFLRIFNFLSGSSVEANVTSHMALTQDTPGDLKLVVKDCSSLLGSFSVSLQKG